MNEEKTDYYMNLKIVTFVPVDYADTVRQAMAEAGAGVQSNYTHCSFSSIGIGRFMPGTDAMSFIGETGQLEAVQEERIEVICQRNNAKAIIAAIKAVHPYEEATIDVMLLLDETEL